MKQLEMDLDRPDVAEAKAKVREMAEKHRAERAAERAKPEPSSRPIPSATDPESVLGPRKGAGTGGGMGTGKMNRDITKNYKKGGKVKKFNDGGMSLEEMYPEAKITRAGPQPKPVEKPPKTALQEALREVKEAEYKDMSKKAELAPYERKAEKFAKSASRGAGGYGEGDLERGMMGSRMPKPKMKSGGKVKSASARADGCAIRGKTRA